MTFQLLRLQPDTKALSVWAIRNGVLSPDGDYGYALHGLFSAAFGEKVPKPFRYLGGRQGLLAYTEVGLDVLRMNASLAMPDVARILRLNDFDAREFPIAWKKGQILGFEVRVRPVVRAKDGRERDAFLHAIGDMPAEENVGMSQRTRIYGEWLSKQFLADDAASIIEVQMDAFSLTRVLRKAGSRENGKRKACTVTGPDVIFKGRMKVGNSEGFARLLTRGVGRHRAFGFGMLLLKPASFC